MRHLASLIVVLVGCRAGFDSVGEGPDSLAPDAAILPDLADPDAAPVDAPDATVAVRVLAANNRSSGTNTRIDLVANSDVAAGDRVLIVVRARPLTTTTGANVTASDVVGNIYGTEVAIGNVGDLVLSSTVVTAPIMVGDTITVQYPTFSGSSVAVAVAIRGAAAGPREQRAGTSGTNNLPDTGTMPATRRRTLLVAAFGWTAGTNIVDIPGFDPLIAYAGSENVKTAIATRAVDPGTYGASAVLGAWTSWAAAVVAYPLP
jgi:hypothetical protein